MNKNKHKKSYNICLDYEINKKICIHIESYLYAIMESGAL